LWDDFRFGKENKTKIWELEIARRQGEVISCILYVGIVFFLRLTEFEHGFPVIFHEKRHF